MLDPIALESSIRPYDPNYRVYLRDETTLQRTGELDDFVSFDAVLRFNEPATWVLNVPRDSPAAELLDIGAGIIVMRADQVILSGPVRVISDELTPDGDMREVSGIDDTGLLGDRLALPVPGGPPYTAAEFDTFTGTAEDALRYFVNRNAGEGATAARRIPRLIAGTFQAIGRPIAFRSSRTIVWNNLRSIYAQRPPGTVAGDTMLILLEGDDNDITFTPPDDSWTQLMASPYANHTAEVWWKRCGSSEPSSYRWRSNLTCDGRAGVSAWSGVHPTDPTDGFGVAVEEDTNDPTTPSITTTTANTQIVTFFAKTERKGLTPPAGFSERYDQDNIMEADAPKDATGPTGPKTAISGSVSDTYAAFIVALRADNASATDQISAQGRFDNLLELTQSIAIQGGGLRFVIKQVGTERTFSVERISDLSDTIIFSQQLGTLVSAGHEREGPLANYVYAGGGGEGTAREFVERGDTTTLQSYWRAESFADKRSQTGAELGQAIDEELEKGGPHVGYTLEPVESEVVRFGRDYELGDTVTVVIGGTAYAATVREANLHLDASGAIITPTLNPTASTGASRGFSAGALSRRLSNIERTAEGFTLGMGMLWSREPEFIPSGWGLCDGTLGTIDMRGRFPLGADPTGAAGRGTHLLGETGGTSTRDLSHTHSGPSHSHGGLTGSGGTSATGSGGALSTDNDTGGSTGSGGAASTDNDTGGSTGSGGAASTNNTAVTTNPGGAASTDNAAGGNTGQGGTSSTDNAGAFAGNSAQGGTSSTDNAGGFSGNTGSSDSGTTTTPSDTRSVTDDGNNQQQVASFDHDHGTGDHNHGINIGSHDHVIGDHEHTVNIPSHDHVIGDHEHSTPSHDHTMSQHQHVGPSHDHSIASHDHSTPSHDHPIAQHDHSTPSHDHPIQPHTHPGTGHDHGISAGGDGNTGIGGESAQNTTPQYGAWHFIQRIAS